LFDALPESEEPAPTEQVSYTRRKGGKDRGDAVTDSGLRFSADVPVEVIHVKDPEVEAIPEEHREVIDEKVSSRARRPYQCSYPVATFLLIELLSPAPVPPAPTFGHEWHHG
jgi:hypothetical protein